MEEKPSDSSDHEDSHANATVEEKQFFNTDADELSTVQVHADSVEDGVVTWEASEFINHQKSPKWYVFLTVAALVLAVVFWVLLEDVLSLVVIAVMYLAVTVYARREPRVLRYSVSSRGISIGEKNFDYDQFKSFSVMQETGIPSISLDPTQRFMPAVSIYFAPQDLDKIVDAMSKFLPMEQKKVNAVDKAMIKLRF